MPVHQLGLAALMGALSVALNFRIEVLDMTHRRLQGSIHVRQETITPAAFTAQAAFPTHAELKRT